MSCVPSLYKKRRSDKMRPSLLQGLLVKNLQVLYPFSPRFSIIWLSKLTGRLDTKSFDTSRFSLLLV